MAVTPIFLTIPIILNQCLSYCGLLHLYLDFLTTALFSIKVVKQKDLDLPILMKMQGISYRNLGSKRLVLRQLQSMPIILTIAIVFPIFFVPIITSLTGIIVLATLVESIAIITIIITVVDDEVPST